MVNFVKEAPIQHIEYDHFPIELPVHYWGEPSPEQRSLQEALNNDYEEILNEIRLLLRSGPKRLIKRFQAIDHRMHSWIDLGFKWTLSPNSADNEKKLRRDGEDLKAILQSLISGDWRE